jgi:threonine dehydrogenase-like Zn-dependent dehydrogenase
VLDELIPRVARGRFDRTAVISHRLPLDRGVSAYEMFDGKTDGCIKAVLRPGSSS